MIFPLPRCVIWSSSRPTACASSRADASRYTSRRASISSICEHLEPQGLGELQLAFEQLKKQLQSEGLFDAARKRPLPSLPRKIGIVTSLDGAAIRDIIKVLRRRYANAHLVICPARVQGEDAAPGIARATAADCARGRRGRRHRRTRRRVDRRSVGVQRRAGRRARSRGCRCRSSSAVGHETDFTIADFAADLRAPTLVRGGGDRRGGERTSSSYARIDRLAGPAASAATCRRPAPQPARAHRRQRVRCSRGFRRTGRDARRHAADLLTHAAGAHRSAPGSRDRATKRLQQMRTAVWRRSTPAGRLGSLRTRPRHRRRTASRPPSASRHHLAAEKSELGTVAAQLEAAQPGCGARARLRHRLERRQNARAARRLDRRAGRLRSTSG